MQTFIGRHKKIITGMGCGLVFLGSAVFASADGPPSSASAVNHTVAAVGVQEENPAAVNPPSVPVSPVHAVKPDQAAAKTNSASQLASLIGGLALILVLIVGLSWFVKRFAHGGFLQNPNIKILSSMPLGTRERLMLVDVGGKQLLLGVTATHINTLHAFEEPVQVASVQPQTSDFSQKLMAILQQKTIAASDPTLKSQIPKE